MSPRRAPRAFVSCLASTVLAAATPLARANDWYVDINDPNCASGTGGPNAPFCNIGTAVSAAANGDTIHIAAGTYFERLVLDKSLTLIGTSGAASTIVDGSSIGTVITITAAAVVDLEGLTVTDGHAPFGGGLYVDLSCNVSLAGCVVSNNSAQFGGGLSILASSDVTLTSCDVSNNIATDYGWYYVRTAEGGGIHAETFAKVTITSSTISNNYSNWIGGGIEGNATVTLIDSVVSGNHISAPSGTGGISGGGAGIHGGTLHLTRSKIVSNHDDYDLPTSAGGGIATAIVDGSEVEITGNHSAGGGGGISSNSVSLTDSLIEGNDAAGGGGLNLGGNSSLTDCVIANNTATGGWGGGAVVTDYTGTVTLDRCTFRGNVASSGDGGAAWIANNPNFDRTSIILRDCAFVGNSTTVSGNGGGLWCSSPLHRQSIDLVRCTVGGNAAAVSGGGLLVNPSGSGRVTIDHTIIAGDTASASADCDGTLYSYGYNCIGDTTGTTITGDNTGNQLDVDPLYSDPNNGDFTLQATSPCVDAGDPAQHPTGMDDAGHPRLLDGNLDRVMVLDMGAFEFDNVNLAITGQATPGGTLTFTTTGTSGLPVFLLLGIAETDVRWRPYGSLFINLGAPWLLLPWGIVPNTQSGSIPSTTPVPLTLLFQELAQQSATRSGNLGNLVIVTIE